MDGVMQVAEARPTRSLQLVVEEVERGLDGVSADDVHGGRADLGVAEFHGDADLAARLRHVTEAQLERQGGEHAHARVRHELRQTLGSVSERKWPTRADCYLDVVVLGAVDVEDDAALVAPRRAVAAHHALAEANALVGHDELVEDVLAVGNAVLDDALLERVAPDDEPVEHRHAVGEARAAHGNRSRVHSVKHGALEYCQADVLFFQREIQFFLFFFLFFQLFDFRNF